jgi:hypothetical protein
MTPRQIAGTLYFVTRRRKHDLAEKLAIEALASRGDPKVVKKQLQDLQQDQ